MRTWGVDQLPGGIDEGSTGLGHPGAGEGHGDTGAVPQALEEAKKRRRVRVDLPHGLRPSVPARRRAVVGGAHRSGAVRGVGGGSVCGGKARAGWGI